MIIYCSKALQTALKVKKDELVSPINSELELYSWHGHITKVDGRNTIILMNDKTRYCLLFRNKLPRNAVKFAEMVREAVAATFEVAGFDQSEIAEYTSRMGEICFGEKPDRQMTGNITQMIVDMTYQWELDWDEDETVQVWEADFQNRNLRRVGKDYVVPVEEMRKWLSEGEVT